MEDPELHTIFPELGVRHGALAQAFHWLTALLVLLALATGTDGLEQPLYSKSQHQRLHLHETLGVLVFALTALRAVWRVIESRREWPGPWPRRGLLAGTVRAALYALMATLPLTGLLTVWLTGHAVALPWGIELGSRLPSDVALTETIAALHGWLADAMLWLIGVHASLVLYHHWILKDGLFHSMWPRRLFQGPIRRDSSR